MTGQATLTTLGDALRRARLQSGLDQDELAARIFASRNTVSNYENGRHGPRGPKEIILRAWARACGVPEEAIVALVRHPGLEPGTRWFEFSENTVEWPSEVAA